GSDRGHRPGADSDGNVLLGLKCAVAVAEKNGDGIVGVIDDGEVEMQVAIYGGIEIRAGDPNRTDAGCNSGCGSHEGSIAIAEKNGKRVVAIVRDDDVLRS